MTSGAQPNKQGKRFIIHVDMDCFFAAVEALINPALRGKPLIVGGDGARGVVASCSYEARSFGVRSAMPSVRARRLCPGATFVSGSYGRYQEFSSRLMNVLRTFSPLVEPLSLDEAFVDITGSTGLFGSPEEIAWQLRAKVYDELSLDCSVGVAGTKHLAKLASVRAKPKASREGPVDGQGVVVISDAHAIEFLHSLEVQKIWGVGPKTAARLNQLGIQTAGQLANFPTDSLERTLGSQTARHLLDLAWNRDDREVVVDREAKSVGHEQTYKGDLVSPQQIHYQLARLADAVSSRLRKTGQGARTVNLKVRFGNFRTITRSRTFDEPTSSGSQLLAAADEMAEDLEVAQGVRLLGLSVSNLGVPTEVAQLSFDSLSITAGGGPSSGSLNGSRQKSSKDSLRESLHGVGANQGSTTAPGSSRLNSTQLDEVLESVREKFGETSLFPAQLANRQGRGRPDLLRHGDQQWGPGSGEPEGEGYKVT